MEDKKEILKKLSEEYNQLKEKGEDEESIKILKQKIWKLKHKGVYKLGNGIENMGKGIFSIFKKGAKKVGEAGRSYESNMHRQLKQRQIHQLDDFAKIIP